MAAATSFRHARGGVTVTFGDDVLLLHELLEQLIGLLGPEELAADADPLEAAVGIGAATEAPVDPALARLLPDAYREDPEAAAEFRRYTETGLREAKRAAARTALASLARPGRRHRLGPDEAQAWLRALNDLRLTLGTRLGVTEDWDELLAGLPEDDARRYALAVYDHLTWLQESLVQALMRA